MLALEFRTTNPVGEQTTRGVIKLAQDAAMAAYAGSIPIVNVAGSAPKRRWEGPHIGAAVARALLRHLGVGSELRGGGSTLVLGFGAIGRAVASSLTDELGVAAGRIFVSDPSPQAQRAALDHGHRLWGRAAPGTARFGLVVGCSGTTSFSIGDRVYLEDLALLASASSGSAELSREQFIELADTHPSDDVYVVDRETLPQTVGSRRHPRALRRPHGAIPERWVLYRAGELAWGGRRVAHPTFETWTGAFEES